MMHAWDVHRLVWDFFQLLSKPSHVRGVDGPRSEASGRQQLAHDRSADAEQRIGGEQVPALVFASVLPSEKSHFHHIISTAASPSKNIFHLALSGDKKVEKLTIKDG